MWLLQTVFQTYTSTYLIESGSNWSVGHLVGVELDYAPGGGALHSRDFA